LIILANNALKTYFFPFFEYERWFVIKPKSTASLLNSFEHCGLLFTGLTMETPVYFLDYIVSVFLDRM